MGRRRFNSERLMKILREQWIFRLQGGGRQVSMPWWKTQEVKLSNV